MTSSPLSRRQVLRGLGGVAVALPFLESLVNPRKVARAGASSKVGYNGRPKRFVAWLSMLGTLPQFHRVEHNGTSLYFPTAMGPDPSFGGPGWPYNPAEWPQIPTGSTEETLDPIKQYMTVLRGVNRPSIAKAHGIDGGVGHETGQCHALTARVDRLVKHPWAPDGMPMPIPEGAPTDAQGFNNWGQCYPSIDQAIARRIDTSSVKYRSLILGDNLDHSGLVFYGENEDIGLANWNPVALFNNLFGEFQMSADSLAALRDQRRSVLDLVMEQANDFKGRVSKRDLHTVESHFDAIRDIEKGLEVVSSCAIPTDLTSGFDGISSWQDFITKGLGTKRYELLFKLLALALKCDLTRVAGVQFYAHTLQVSDVVPASLGVTPSGQSDVHGYSHAVWGDVRGTEIYRHILRWKNKVFADFVLDLASADEGGHSVLDNTVILNTSDLFSGQHETTPGQLWGYNNRAGDPSSYCANNRCTGGNSPERPRDVTTFYVGGCGGALRTGQLLDFADKSKGYNPDRYYAEFGHYSHGEVLLTMARAMGVGPDQLPSFGEPEFCQGEVAEVLTGT